MAVNIKKGQALASLSMTSLIDVVFLLLIFFLVATRFADEDHELDVMLPSASEAQPLIAEQKVVFVNIDKEGRFFMGGKAVGPDEIERGLIRAVTDNPVNQSVVIRADRRVELDAAVVVMNICNKVGIADYSLTTETGE